MGSPSPPDGTASARPAIYLDHHATTPVDARVLDAMLPYFREDFGNAASASHVFGWRAEAAVENARERIAELIGAEAREIVFTSGATEANNLAILGAAERHPERRCILTVATEHPAVLDPCRWLGERGHDVRILGVDANGFVDVGELEAALDDDTLLVSVMAANNEIGVLQPLDAIGPLCRERGALFHSDGAQAVAHVPIDVDAVSLDLLSISGHKIYGPKGIGALFVRSRRPRARIAPRQLGGGHERGLRSGTLPVPLIVGLARAMELCVEEREAETRRLAELRERLWKGISSVLSDVRLNGHASSRLPGNLNLSFAGVDGEKLLIALPDVALSSGSACSSAKPHPSHVLTALGLPEQLVKASLRFGLGRGTTADEVDRAVGRLIEEVEKLRRT